MEDEHTPLVEIYNPFDGKSIKATKLRSSVYITISSGDNLEDIVIDKSILSHLIAGLQKGLS